MIYAIVMGFMVLDFVTGLVKAFATGHYSSTRMREGLFHKCGLTLCVVLGVLVEYAQGYLELGVNMPVAAAVCGYICLMETGSILENLCCICPELMPDRLSTLFGGMHIENK